MLLPPPIVPAFTQDPQETCPPMAVPLAPPAVPPLSMPVSWRAAPGSGARVRAADGCLAPYPAHILQG